MAAVTIAKKLKVMAEASGSTETATIYMGVETSLPLSMAGQRQVALTGTVRGVSTTKPGERCDAEIQGSNDLMRWFTVSSTTLPETVAPFELAGVAVDYAWVRVQWLMLGIDDPIQASTFWILDASLNTNV